MFGHVGSKAVILLNPVLQNDQAALRRALCHEMVHAQLSVAGQPTAEHGPAFQTILRRLSAENAFEGIVATDEERTNLRAWLDAETARLDEEQAAVTQEAAELEGERAEIENGLASLTSRMNTPAAPNAGEVSAYNTRRERYNWRVTQAQARVERGRADRTHFNHEVERYNLMLVYPDGMDAGAMKTKR
jgi:SprT-like family